MKKLLLLAVGAMLSFPVMAQDAIGADVTKYITNAGFDEDLTFQVNGAMKTALTTNTSISNRSWAYICEDSTVYARPKSTSDKNRSDGRKLDAVNGFFGAVKGWHMKLTSTYPNCEWTYFGSVPYGLGATAVPKSDDTNAFIPSPASKPEGHDTPDNLGCLYINAGWGNSASYVQEVTLPCAKYRLEYWTINLNPNASAHSTDMSQIICRRDVFKEENGESLSSAEWIKHEFEFTPVDKFTIQFGIKSAGGTGSGNQEVICIDGIKLVKIDDASELEILQSDLNAYVPALDEIIYGDDLSPYAGITNDFIVILDNLYLTQGSEDIEELKAAIETAKKLLEDAQAALEDAQALEALIGEAEAILNTSDYPGKETFGTAIQEASVALTNGTAEEVHNMLTTLKQAITDYYMSQVATEETPADFTNLYVQNPWFINSSAISFDEQGNPVYVNNTEETPYNNGSSNADLNSTGWYIGESGGDQRLNWVQGRSCWNAWRSGFQTIALYQDIAGLPNGYYKVSGDLITQPGFCTSQHIMAKSTLQTAQSPFLTVDGWNAEDPAAGIWTTLTTSEKVLVVDGKLTIGAESTGDGSTAAGWFCATNFKLLYCGEASDEDIKAALQSRVSEVESLAEGMHFGADKAAVNDSLAKYKENLNLETLTAAADLAQTSEAKYAEIMEEGKSIPTYLADIEEGKFAGAEDILNYALNSVLTWITSSEGTYSEVDAKLNALKAYGSYCTVYYNANNLVTTSNSDAVKKYLGDIMAAHKAKLTAEFMTDGVSDLEQELSIALNVAARQEQYDANPNATDYTGFIINPAGESELGWAIEKGTGDKASTSGEYYNMNEPTHRYFDSYNSTAGNLNFYGEQLIAGVPNGTYTVAADVRTSGEGAFIFGANVTEEKVDTVWLEMPLQTYTRINQETGEEETVNATNYYGQIWEDAVARFQTMTEADPDYFTVQGIANAHAGEGFGWEHIELAGVVVTDHKILIGMTTDALRSGKAFTGTWFSVTNWTLTLTAAGDNTDWDGPISSGIEEIAVAEHNSVDGIYNVNGQRVNAVNRPGLYIVVRNGKATKVLMK